MGFRVLPHTADTGLEATADTLAGLIEQLATGMFALMASVPADCAGMGLEVSLGAPTLEDLVVDCLSELLARAEVDDVILRRFAVDLEPGESGGWQVTIRAAGVPAAEAELVGPPVKAVTYHALAVQPRGEGWYGRVYFDV